MSTCSAINPTRRLTAASTPQAVAQSFAARTDSPFAVAAREIAASVTNDPSSITIDGRSIGHGLPARMIHMSEVGRLLAHPSTHATTRDEVWRVVIGQSRTLGGLWATAAIGLALPALRTMSARLHRQFSKAETSEIDGELMIGFLAALGSIELGSDRVLTRLCTPTFTTARRNLRIQFATAARTVQNTVLPAPGRLHIGDEYGVLNRAVARGIISLLEADVIARTRLEDMDLRAYAEANQRDYSAVMRCRNRGEQKLDAAHKAGDLARDEDVILDATTVTIADTEHAAI